jgi:hypothetical protein
MPKFQEAVDVSTTLHISSLHNSYLTDNTMEQKYNILRKDYKIKHLPSS